MEWFNLDDDCFSLCKMQMLAGVRIYVKIISYTLIQPLGYERIYERQLFVYIVLLLEITNFKIAFSYLYNSSTSKNSICTNSIKQSWNKLWLKVLRLLLSVLRAKKKKKRKKIGKHQKLQHDFCLLLAKCWHLFNGSTRQLVPMFFIAIRIYHTQKNFKFPQIFCISKWWLTLQIDIQGVLSFEITKVNGHQRLRQIYG